MPNAVTGKLAEWDRKIAAGEDVRADKRTLFRGAPDWDDPRRCQSKRNHRRWAVGDSGLCRMCGGHRHKANAQVRTDLLPRFYSKRLGPALSELVEEHLGVHPDEQVALYEELAVLRTMAGDALGLWAGARSLPEDNPRRDVLLSAAEMIVRQALDAVRVMAEAAARVRLKGADQVSVHNLAFVVNQIVKISHEVLKDEPDRAKQFERLVRDEVRVLQEQKAGTQKLPGDDADAMAMDATVPAG